MKFLKWLKAFFWGNDIDASSVTIPEAALEQYRLDRDIEICAQFGEVLEAWGKQKKEPHDRPRLDDLKAMPCFNELTNPIEEIGKALERCQASDRIPEAARQFYGVSRAYLEAFRNGVDRNPRKS